MSGMDDELKKAREKLNQSVQENQYNEKKNNHVSLTKFNVPKINVPDYSVKINKYIAKLIPYKKKIGIGIVSLFAVCGLTYYISIPKLSDVESYTKEHNVGKLVSVYNKTFDNKEKYVDVRSAAIEALVNEYNGTKDTEGLIKLYKSCPQEEIDNVKKIIKTIVGIQTVEGNNFLENEVVAGNNKVLIVDEFIAKDDKFLDWKIQKFQGEISSLSEGDPFSSYEKVLNKMVAFSFRDPSKFHVAIAQGSIKSLLTIDKYNDTAAFVKRYVKDYSAVIPSTVKQYIDEKEELSALRNNYDAKNSEINNVRSDLSILKNKDFSYIEYKTWWIMEKLDDHEYACRASDGYVVLQTVSVDYTTTGWVSLDVKYVGKRNNRYNIFKQCNDRIENNNKIYAKQSELWNLERERNDIDRRISYVSGDIYRIENTLRQFTAV